uniref:Uncharacterized protein n=1 Tax=Myoviridae sp. ctBtT5 TaxID=2825048 RepID=A0A8S5PZ84_9CAUD|nr:MAG TPA: hypothetical protein [Myoviridae sp. ctBtT5]
MLNILLCKFRIFPVSLPINQITNQCHNKIYQCKSQPNSINLERGIICQ